MLSIFSHLSLRRRFSLLIISILVAGVAIGYGTFVWRSHDALHTLGGWFAERNALYEKSKIERGLDREVVLTQKMATSGAIIDWVHAEANPVKRAAARQELESFRTLFSGGSYFIVIAGSGHYYYTDQDTSHPLEKPSYTLGRGIEKDAWFYLTLEHVQDYQLNVDTDRHLKKTKVWINAVMRKDGRPIAVVGTGIDLSQFNNRMMRNNQHGVLNMLLDRDGAIQAQRDLNSIDFGSIRRSALGEKRNTIYQSLQGNGDPEELQSAMANLQDGAQAQIIDLVINAERRIGALTYLPEIKWFLLTLTKPESALDEDILTVAALVFTLTLAASLLLAGLCFERMVLRPLEHLDDAVRQLTEGDYDDNIPGNKGSEIEHLAQAFKRMATRIKVNTKNLEQEVESRTHELAQLAYKDLLTGLLNRRGLYDQLPAIRNRIVRHQTALGLIMIDIDHFKACNDTFGHEIGDHALTHLAKLFRQELRGYDLCSRWGGEEFLIAVEIDTGSAELIVIAEKLRQKVKDVPLIAHGQTIDLSISLGVCLLAGDESTASAINRADAALYKAKAAGRDQVVFVKFANDRLDQIV